MLVRTIAVSLCYSISVLLSWSIAKATSKSEVKAEANFDFRCVNQMPTTSFLLNEKNGKMVLTMIHHNGVKFMPIHYGVIVPNDLPYLREKTSILTQMSDRVEFEFPKENCRKVEDEVLSCSSGSTLKFGGYEMEALRIATSKVTETTTLSKYELNKVTLSLHIHGYAPVQDLTIYYYGSECKFH